MARGEEGAAEEVAGAAGAAAEERAEEAASRQLDGESAKKTVKTKHVDSCHIVPGSGGLESLSSRPNWPITTSNSGPSGFALGF